MAQANEEWVATLARGRDEPDGVPNGDPADGLVPVSVLFRDPTTPLLGRDPDYFGDLHLDGIATAIFAGWDAERLVPVFRTSLERKEDILDRQAVFQDLRRLGLAADARGFVEATAHARRLRLLAAHAQSPVERDGWILEAQLLRADAVGSLADALARAGQDLTSPALHRVSTFLGAYRGSVPFRELVRTGQEARQQLDAVAYTLTLHGGRVTVRRSAGEPDYGDQILTSFARFARAAVPQLAPLSRRAGGMDTIESRIVDLVARLFPDPFSSLRAFCETHGDHRDPTIDRLEEELPFYLAVLDHVDKVSSDRLPFSLPELATQAGDLRLEHTFDLALADSPTGGVHAIVTNDVALTAPERTIVITGPNQGGKTTLARAVGQAHHLAAIGCPVPGRRARVVHVDQLWSHFGTEESVTDRAGKLEEDLERIHVILERLTPRSLVILNELFASTTLEDARLLGGHVLDRIGDSGATSVYVTFVDELASWNESVVSMMSTVDPDDPANRTFRVERRAADGLAHAVALAAKHGLTVDRLRTRLSP